MLGGQRLATIERLERGDGRILPEAGILVNPPDRENVARRAVRGGINPVSVKKQDMQGMKHVLFGIGADQVIIELMKVLSI